MQHVSFKTYSQALEFAGKQAHDAALEEGRCILLASSYSQVVRAKKQVAASGEGFGVAVETPSSWIADLWEMLGDGRQLVSPVDRSLIACKALLQQDVLRFTPGMVRTVADTARYALPFALQADPQDETVCAVRDCLVAYDQLLCEEGLIEESLACQMLAQMGAADGLRIVVLDCSTSASQDLLLQGQGVTVVGVDAEMEAEADVAADDELDSLRRALFHPDFQNPVQAEGKVRFVLPAGAYAQPRLLIDQLVQSVRRVKGEAPVKVAVSTRNPLELFDQIAPGLTRSGMDVRVNALCRYGDTSFGKAWKALMAFVSSQDWEEVGSGFANASLASDFDESVFSFMGLRQAQAVDGRMRAWRGQTVDDALTDMAGFAQEDKRDFMAAIADQDFVRALQIQRDWIDANRSWPDAYRAQQLSAVDVTLDVVQRAGQLGLSLEVALQTIENVVIPASAQLSCGLADAPVVEVMSMRDMAGLEPESRHVAVLCDLSAAAYPLKDEMRAADLLMAQLGAGKRVDRIAQTRRWFADALAAASNEVALQRCLNDDRAEELRPAALLEELIDCYRHDPQNPEEVDKKLGLPEALLPYAVTLGEEAVAANLDASRSVASLQEQTLQRYAAGCLSQEDRAKVAPVVHDPIAGTGCVRLSPSAIENYLECPYKWFAQNRLGLSQLDADFGPRAFGTFSHAVLEKFHTRMMDEGLRRVTVENLAIALELLDDEFDRQMKRELQRIGEDDALIPLNQIERSQVEGVRRNLKDFVRWEAKLLPDFAPYKAELRFGKDDPFDFAGVKVTGVIDRIDTDGFGRAAVIDYKGSVKIAHDFRAKDATDWALPRKIQAVVYAQAARRRLGLTPVAALYVSHMGTGAIGGLYDACVLDAKKDLLGINFDRCSSMEFLDELDRCEEAVANVLERLRAGDIQPRPVDADACTYCPVSLCERRMS